MDQNHSFHDLRAPLREARRRFLVEIEPLRPELFRFARGLTRSYYFAPEVLRSIDGARTQGRLPSIE